MKHITTEKISNKICSNAGESIAETLVALLISALALVLLAGTISASSGIITVSREKLADYYSANEGLVYFSSDTVTDDYEKTTSVSGCKVYFGDEENGIDVVCYKNGAFSDKEVYAYKGQ